MYITTSEMINRGVFPRVMTPIEPILTENEKAELISTAANESTIFWTWKIVRDLSRDEVPESARLF